LAGINHLSLKRVIVSAAVNWVVTASVVNLWRSRPPVYHTDRRHLCTTRWAWGTASRRSVSGSGDVLPVVVTVFSEDRVTDGFRSTTRWRDAAGGWLRDIHPSLNPRLSVCPSHPPLTLSSLCCWAPALTYCSC